MDRKTVLPDFPLSAKRWLAEGFQLLHTGKSPFFPVQLPDHEALQQTVEALKDENTVKRKKLHCCQKTKASLFERRDVSPDFKWCKPEQLGVFNKEATQRLIS